MYLYKITTKLSRASLVKTLLIELILLMISSSKNRLTQAQELNSVLDINNTFPYLIDKLSGYLIEPRNYMDFDNIYTPNDTYKLTQTSQGRAYHLLKAFDFANYYQADYWHYSNKEDLKLSAWPIANQARCLKQLNWLELQLNNSFNLFKNGQEHMNLMNLVDSFGRPESNTYYGRNLWIGSHFQCMRTSIDISIYELEEKCQKLLSNNINNNSTLLIKENCEKELASLSNRKLNLQDDTIIKGRYCLAKARDISWPEVDDYKPEITYKIGLCLPESCETLSYERHRDLIERLMKYQMVDYMKKRISINDLYCLPDSRSPIRSLNYQSQVFIGLNLIWLLTSLLATIIYSCFKSHKRDMKDILIMETNNTNNNNNSLPSPSSNELLPPSANNHLNKSPLSIKEIETSTATKSINQCCISSNNNNNNNNNNNSNSNNYNQQLPLMVMNSNHHSKRGLLLANAAPAPAQHHHHHHHHHLYNQATINNVAPTGSGEKQQPEVVVELSEHHNIPTSNNLITDDDLDHHHYSNYMNHHHHHLNHYNHIDHNHHHQMNHMNHHHHPHHQLHHKMIIKSAPDQLSTNSYKSSSASLAAWLSESPKLIKIFKCLSLVENIKEFSKPPLLLRQQEESSTLLRINLNALDFIKCFCCVMVIFGHIVFIHMQHNRNIIQAIELSYEVTPRILIAFFNFVDTFFIISGMLTAYFILKRFNVKTFSTPLIWLKISFLRLIRLSPIYLLVFWFAKTISVHLYDGPLWDYGTDKNSIRGLCINDQWWKSILYFGNVGTMQPLCILPSWSIIVDSQYSLIIPPIIYLLLRFKKMAYLLLLFATIISTGKMSLQLANQTAVKTSDMAKIRFHVYPLISRFAAEFYNTAWNRIGPVAIGIVGGHMLYLYDIGKIRRWPWFMRDAAFKLVLIMHLFIFILPTLGKFTDDPRGRTSTVIISNPTSSTQQNTMDNHDNGPDLTVFLLSNAAIKPIWSIINTILLLRLVTDLKKHSIAAKLASHNVWHSLGKLCFIGYLIHYELILILLKSREDGYLVANWSNAIKEFSVVFLISSMLSYVIYILYEAPINKLITLIMSKPNYSHSTTNKTLTTTTNTTTNKTTIVNNQSHNQINDDNSNIKDNNDYLQKDVK